MIEKIKKILPILSAENALKSKGLDGRIGVIGGSAEYTGAPYFAAASALRTGADLVHVFCSPMASPVIKGYSPELIVHPTLQFDDIAAFFKRLDVLIIGPGLGREKETLDSVAQVIQEAKSARLPLIIDADGIFLVQNRPDLIKGYSSCILTPNINEFERLLKSQDISLDDHNAKQLLSQKYGGVTIVQKGLVDLIVRDTTILECNAPGSARRIGGQGDILAGSIATFLAWSLKSDSVVDSYTLASFAGCRLLKECSRAAFEKHGRGVLTSHILEEIGPQFRKLFDSK